ncbi:GNAT family N-acetyltransferase [Bifidobacterium sp. MA2]|uniref:GNAT family N-acetyltransferase n=2 Tax=Bifidobacterium santillanense TaxID=2809028 RepID=A0ABS5ULP6_9BIFI|nr:GNAT family N-acetyltransferase [Bifidobacterium santillanense]
MDVQRYIRDLRVRDEPGVCRLVLQYGDKAGGAVVGFCEFGYDPASPESSGYAISFIATASSERGRHLGRYLLDGVLRWMANDAARHRREPYVLTQIDPSNHASVHLFSDLGFIDEGVDEDDPEYHIWSKWFEPVATDRLYLYVPVELDD